MDAKVFCRQFLKLTAKPIAKLLRNDRAEYLAELARASHGLTGKAVWEAVRRLRPFKRKKGGMRLLPIARTAEGDGARDRIEA